MQANRIYVTLCGVITLLTAGCTTDDDAEGIVLKTSATTTEKLLPTANQKKDITFETTASWTASTTAPWLTVSPGRGSKGSNTITATTTAINRTKVDRQAQVVIKSGSNTKNITIIQSGDYALFDSKVHTVPAEGGSVAMTFRSNITDTERLVVAYQQLDWLSFAGGGETRREWNGTLTTINVAPNTSRQQRGAAFALALRKDDGSLAELDTATVIQAGQSTGYTSTDFSHDGEVTVLQQHTVGHGIPVVLMGDGFADRDISDSTYHRTMAKAMENLFSEEPVRSLRDYFDVYQVTAVSVNDAVGSDYNTVFSSVPDYTSTHIDADAARVTQYAEKTNRPDSLNMLVVVILNSNVHNGVTYLYSRGNRPSQFAIAFCPICDDLDSELFRQVLVHEAIGHGLAKLADEYGYEKSGTADDEAKRQVDDGHSNSWYLNVDTSADSTRVAWWQFIDNASFANELIGTYEGGFTYTKGIWKPTVNSMMNQNDCPFNAPSRKAIYDRIRLLGENAKASTMGQFADFDALHKPQTWQYPNTRSAGIPKRIPAPPVIICKE
jgi:hypothetical protein